VIPRSFTEACPVEMQNVSVDPILHLSIASFLKKLYSSYRYRGYRMALMEAGSMYQNAGLVADQIGLRNRVWAGFTDSYVAKTMNVDQRTAAADCSIFWRCHR
jgi:hypothetical protein